MSVVMQRVMRGYLVAAIAVTLVGQRQFLFETGRRAVERIGMAHADRDRVEESFTVTSMLEALAKAGMPAGRVVVVLPRPPGMGDELLYLVYRLRYRMYPRAIDFVYPGAGRWMPVDLDYRRKGPVAGHEGLGEALEGADVVVNMAGLAAPPAGFRDATPVGAFGFNVLVR